jgi:hypothetical protein
MLSLISSHFVAAFLTLRPFLAQDSDTTNNAAGAAGAIGGGVGGIIGLLVAVIMIIAMWKIYSKANQPGWAAIIPIYNYIVWCKIVGRPLWWVILLFLCFPIFYIILTIDLAKSFGKSTGFAIGMIFLPFIFWLALAFGDATYQGPSAAPVHAPVA